VLERIHILEGRQIVLLNIDEVIAIIRQSDEPKAALIARFKLSDRQAEDILEIRLRQLARLEAIKIEQELSELRSEQAKLEEILNSPATLKRLMIKEIEADAKTFTDARRTLIQEERRVVAEIKIIDEPLTVIISEKGWVRTQKAHGIDAATLAFKAGDALLQTFECRTIDALIVFGTAKDKSVRVYSVAVSTLPGGRGDGVPISTLIELEAGTQAAHYFAGAVEQQLLISSSGGYGFYASVANMIGRQKAGKAFVTLGEHDGKPEAMNPPVHIVAKDQVICASREGRLLSFALSDLRQMAGGGRGLMLMDIDSKDVLAGVAIIPQGTAAMLYGLGRTGKEKTEKLDPKMIAMMQAPRGRKGKILDVGFKVTGIKGN
jgi:topoisomerase IV subunit A